MKSLINIVLLCLITGNVHAQDLETIISKHLDAMGGIQQLQRITSISKKGHIVASGNTIAVQCLQQEAKGYKQVITAGGMKEFLIVTPNAAWQYRPGAGDVQVNAMDKETSSSFSYLLHPRNMLIDRQQNDWKVSLDGKAIISGEELIRLKCVDSNQNEIILLLDPNTYLLRMQINRRKIHNDWQEQLTEYDDYRKLDGVMMPYTMSLPIGKVHFEKIELNIVVDEREFMPFKN